MIESLNECLAFERELKLDDVFRNHEEWDSMCRLILLTCLEENCSIKINSEEFKKYETIKQIIEDFSDSYRLKVKS
jgi:acyl carrier protein